MNVLSTAKYFQTGRVGIIGATPVQVYLSGSLPLRYGVLIKADSGNLGAVFVGQSNVTTNSNTFTDGYPLRALESQLFPVDNLSGVYLVANQGSGNIAWWFAS